MSSLLDLVKLPKAIIVTVYLEKKFLNRMKMSKGHSEVCFQ